MIENERLAKVETNVDWLVKAVAKMGPKLDHLVQKSELRWGKIIGAIISVNAILALIAVAIWH